MAKGVEDTAFYRWFRLSSLNEVGGDPEHFGVSPEEFHAFAARLNRALAEDDDHAVHPRHQAIRGRPGPARCAVRAACCLGRGGPGVAAAVRGPPEPVARRQHGVPVLADAVRHLGRRTAARRTGCRPTCRRRSARPSGTPPGPRRTTEYEQAVAAFATAVLADDAVLESVRRFAAQADRVRPGGHARPEARPADDARRTGRLPGQRSWSTCPWWTRTTGGRWTTSTGSSGWRGWTHGAKPDDLSDEKLLVTSRALRLRRQYPEAFAGTYTPLPTSNGHAVAFARGDAVHHGGDPTARRHCIGLGGWGDSTVVLPSGLWRNVLTGHEAWVVEQPGSTSCWMTSRWPCSSGAEPTVGRLGSCGRTVWGRTWVTDQAPAIRAAHAQQSAGIGRRWSLVSGRVHSRWRWPRTRGRTSRRGREGRFIRRMSSVFPRASIREQPLCVA